MTDLFNSYEETPVNGRRRISLVLLLGAPLFTLFACRPQQGTVRKDAEGLPAYLDFP